MSERPNERRGELSGSTGAPGGRKRRSRLGSWAVVLAALPAWELLRTLAGVSPLLMPPLIEILGTLLENALSGLLLQQIGVSLLMILAGGVAALLLSLLALLLAGAFPVAEGAIRIVGSLLHPLPGIALLPVIVLWFGIGPVAVFVVILHSVFWPVLTNLQAGYRSIPGTWTMVAENYQISGAAYLFRIALPATSPYLLAGLRIAWARAWRALISAEMLFGAVAATGGLGWFIHGRRVFMDSAGLFAGILAVMFVGSVVERVVFTSVERRTVRRWGMST
ncbi:MAG: ABC transporter permease [Spirochaetaceae bacterium]